VFLSWCAQNQSVCCSHSVPYSHVHLLCVVLGSRVLACCILLTVRSVLTGLCVFPARCAHRVFPSFTNLSALHCRPHGLFCTLLLIVVLFFAWSSVPVQCTVCRCAILACTLRDVSGKQLHFHVTRMWLQINTVNRQHLPSQIEHQRALLNLHKSIVVIDSGITTT
jgi:hypothetical protein